MKISSSSSLIFATLAISSSSSSLAAPAGDNVHSEGVYDAQQSVRRTSVVDRSVIQPDLDSRQLVANLPVLGSVLGPVLDPVLDPVLGPVLEPIKKMLARRDQLDAINSVTQVPGNVTQLLPISPSSVMPLSGLPTPASLPGKRSEADEVADSSSVSTSCTSTATDASSSATQGSMSAAGIPVPIDATHPPISTSTSPVALVPQASSLPGPGALPLPSSSVVITPPLLAEEVM